MFLTEFFGRLHPLLVHLPIGILLFAFAMILWQRFQKVEIEQAISFALLLGSLSAVFACVAGWFLAQTGEYDADLVFQHQWMGILTAVSGFASYFIKRIRDILTTVTICVLMITGHWGGNLTHGENFLFPKKKDPIKVIATSDNISKEAEIASNTTVSTSKKPKEIMKKSFLFRDEVLPVLEKKCFSCHSETKKKGGLRLDTEEFIRLGGKNGPVFIAGNPENSPLYFYLLLPEEDDNHMPPKGKPQLTSQEINLLHEWIKQGASFQELLEAETFLSAKIIEDPLAENKLPLAAKPDISVEPVTLQDMEALILKSKIEPVSPFLVEQFKQQNIILSHFGTNSNFLMVNFVNVREYHSSMIDDLLKLGNQVVRLRMSQQPVNDTDIKKLSALKNITRLNLEKTAITDGALKYIKDLPKLEQLNLYGTNITDNGLLELTKCPQLKIVFLWQTKTTDRGIEELKRALPHLQIELGGFQFAKPDTVKTKNID